MWYNFMSKGMQTTSKSALDIKVIYNYLDLKLYNLKSKSYLDELSVSKLNTALGVSIKIELPQSSIQHNTLDTAFSCHCSLKCSPQEALYGSQLSLQFKMLASRGLIWQSIFSGSDNTCNFHRVGLPPPASCCRAGTTCHLGPNGRRHFRFRLLNSSRPEVEAGRFDFRQWIRNRQTHHVTWGQFN